MAEIAVGSADFKAFARSLGRAQPALRTAMVRQMRAGGQLVADQAKSNLGNASSSTRIKVSTAKSSVAVVATSPGPIAGLLELGNIGSSASSATFRHPVYGNGDAWVSQPTHPFLYPALQSRGAEALALINQAVGEAFEIAARF